MVTFKRTDSHNVVDASFEPALLVDKRGKINHANSAANSLLQMNHEDGPDIDALMVFRELTSSENNELEKGDYSWKDVSKHLSKQVRPCQWHVQCFAGNGANVFMADICLVRTTWSDGKSYILIYIRISHHHGAGGEGHSRSPVGSSVGTHAGGGTKRALQKSNNPNMKKFDESSDPMLAIDQVGTVMGLNQAAVENIPWCADPDIVVGQPITKCFAANRAMFDASHDPIMGIDKNGTIVSVNDAALEDLKWCSSDWIGQSLMTIGSDNETSAEIEQGSQKHHDSAKLYSWFGGVGKQPKRTSVKRKDSPQVLRIFVVKDHPEDDSSTIADESRGNLTNGSSDQQQKESILWAIVEASLDPLFQINAKGIIHMVNEAAVRQFGYSREEFLGCNISMIVGGGHASKHDKYLKRYLETGITKVIGQKRLLTAQRRDGTEFPIELGVVEVETYQGDDRLFCGFVHDLTSIQKRERITEDIVEASIDPMFVITESGKVKRMNEAAVVQFGYSKKELVGQNISAIVGGDHASKHDKYMKNYLTTGHTKVIGQLRELPARRKDGSEFPIQLGVVEMKTNQDEERMFCGYIHDITSIRSNARISKGIIESSLDSMLQIDEFGNIEMVNQAAVDTFGWTREEFLGKNIKMIVNKQHRDKHDEYLKRFRETRITNLVGKRREMMACRKDGTEFPVDLNIAPIEDHVTKETKFCGFLRNLTDLKHNEQNLLKRERLMTGMINASISAMFQIDQEGIILTVNQAATRVFGWAEEELIGNNVSMIVGKDHAGKHDEYLKRYLQTGEARVMGKTRELFARKKDGSEFPIQLSLSEVVTTEGPRAFCGFVRDLSELTAQSDISNGMIDASLDPMFLIDSRGLIMMVNQAASTHFGWSKEEFINSNIKMIVGGEHAGKHDGYLKNFLDTRTPRVIGKRRTLPGRRKDGSEFNIELAVVEVERSSGSFFCGYARVL